MEFSLHTQKPHQPLDNEHSLSTKFWRNKFVYGNAMLIIVWNDYQPNLHSDKLLAIHQGKESVADFIELLSSGVSLLVFLMGFLWN